MSKRNLNVGWTMVLRSIRYYLIVLALLPACKHKDAFVPVAGGDYPADVANIILTKCATEGCHNSISYTAAANLDLTTWNGMFRGSGTGSVAIPYRSDFSSLCYFTNTDSSLGVVMLPTMPVNRPPLSRVEYNILKRWIDAGAPNINGQVKFAEQPGRSKIYVTNRMCDVVTVFDVATMLQMRYIDVGDKQDKEFPVCVKTTPDRKYWFVSFFTYSDIVQRYDAATDKPAGDLKLSTGTWTSFAITSDSRFGFFVDNSGIGKIVYADLEQMKVLATYTFGNSLVYPIGIAIDNSLKKLYLGCTNGNFIYSVDITDPMSPIIKQVVIDGSSTIKYETSLDPSELLLDEENNTCYIACYGSGEIRVLDMQKDSLLYNIPLGAAPAFMSLSKLTHKLFVSCPDDEQTFPGNRGAVAVIDLNTRSIVKKINTGYQPYGLVVNDEQKNVAVINANIASGGPSSHHISRCGQKNGNVTFIDIDKLELVPGKRREVAVYPYSMALR